jgi:predicted nucleic acid-binding protein
MPCASGGCVAVLVDSSLWVHHLRRSGDAVQRARVVALLESGEAAWCPVVRLELWRGVNSETERKTLRRFEALLPDYEITTEVWAAAIAVADRGRAAGITVPLADLLVFACADTHGLEVAHDDGHFDDLGRLSR